jgi:hypothetical protein
VVQRAPRVQRAVGLRSTSVRRGTALALVAVAAFSVAGCQYLFGLAPGAPPGGILAPGGSFDPGMFASFDPADFSFPAPQAVFTHGTATLEVGGKTEKLDQLGAPAAIYADLGTEVLWTDGKGRFLRVFDDGDTWLLTLDRIENASHWTTQEEGPGHCAVKIDHADSTGVKGTASCTALRWLDMMAAFVSPQPPYVPGQAPFDARISFEATP